MGVGDVRKGGRAKEQTDRSVRGERQKTNKNSGQSGKWSENCGLCYISMSIKISTSCQTFNTFSSPPFTKKKFLIKSKKTIS